MIESAARGLSGDPGQPTPSPAGPDRARVVDVLARHHGVQVAVVLDRAAPASEIAELLDTGVTACVREGPAPLVVGHLVACRRRRADRAPG